MMYNFQRVVNIKPIIYIICLLFLIQVSYAEDISVSTGEQLKTAFLKASAGTRIVLLPGTYDVYRLDTHSGGTAQKPITVEASIFGAALIHATGAEAISIHHPYWIVKGLSIEGGAQSDHAFHISGNADNVVIKHNTLVNFHSQIKVNGIYPDFPDNGLIENNDIFNTQVRETTEPVTPIDIVGGKHWIVRGNYIADFAKGLGDKTSYGLFIKGNSSNGLIEKNLILCEKDTVGGVRIGMSLGGGGTGTAYCENRDCAIEHTGGIMRNNIILNCPDVGVYLNKARDTVIQNNTLLMTVGIDVRFPKSSAIIKNNILTGSIRERDGGRAEILENAVFGTQFGMWLPSLNDRLQLRISDYHNKFPGWVTRDNVVKTQDLMGGFFSYLKKTSLGLGENRTQECFPELIIGNIKPNNALCGTFWQSNDIVADMLEEDFWGNKRSAGKNPMGAIDFGSSTCNIMDRIQHKPIKASSSCLD